MAARAMVHMLSSMASAPVCGGEGNDAHAIERLSLYTGHGTKSGRWDTDGVCGHWELSESCRESDLLL